jgi:alanine racemase
VATFLGGDGAERIPAEEIASLAGTIPYEILTGMAARLPRMIR